MTNWEIALIFYEIADLLDILGENPFKSRAYRQAAHLLEHTQLDVAVLIAEGRLQELPGIGASLAQKIQELVTTGELRYYEKLAQKVPPSTRQLLRVPGIGVKTAHLLFKELQITDLDELEEAARGQRLRQLPGIGRKTEKRILKYLETMAGRRQGWLLDVACAVAEVIEEFLKGLPGVTETAVAGSLRRGREMVGDLDFVVAAAAPSAVISAFKKASFVQDVVAADDASATIRTKWELPVDLLVVSPKHFAAALLYLTGSEEHYAILCQLAQGRGWKLSECGITAGKEEIFPASEDEIYKLLGLPYIPPELREGQDEVEVAFAGKLPLLIDNREMKGDLHVHTNWSDGVDSIEKMAMAARERGYSYLAITDHSQSLRVARGLTPEKVRQQLEVIRSLNDRFGDFRILAGIEVEILLDGKLDFDDKLLEELDLVVASIHTGFQQDQETITARLIAAIENKQVDIIGHPTGRLLGRREPYQIDLEQVLDAAAETGTALEINASPDRLDLNAQQIRLGKERGVRFAINTDAHSQPYFEDMRFGVLTARHGWAEKDDIINTKPLSELNDWLQEKI
jgi:DNA polymerase (family 10)